MDSESSSLILSLVFEIHSFWRTGHLCTRTMPCISRSFRRWLSTLGIPFPGPSKMLRDSLALRSGVPQHHSQELDHYIWGLERGKALSLEKRSVQDARSDLWLQAEAFHMNKWPIFAERIGWMSLLRRRGKRENTIKGQIYKELKHTVLLYTAFAINF